MWCRSHCVQRETCHSMSRLPRLALLVGFFAIVGVFCGTGTTASVDIESSSVSYGDGAPLFVLWRFGASTEEIRNGKTGPCQLLCAIWSDGFIIYSKGWAATPESMLTGTVHPDKLQEAIKGMNESSLAEYSGHDYEVPAASCFVININQDGKTQWVSWDERIRQGTPQRVTTEFKKFVQAWYAAKLHLATLAVPPSEETPISASASDELRGYHPTSPCTTEWMRRIYTK